MMRVFLFIVISLFFIPNLKAQQQDTVPEIKVNVFFDYVSLDEAFKTLKEKYHIDIKYDSLYFQSIKGFTQTFTEAEVPLVFMRISNLYNLKYTVNKDGSVTVTPRSAIVVAASATTVNNNTTVSTKTGTNIVVRKYTGPAENTNYTLSGTLKDRFTGEALPFATVLVKGSTNGVSSNADGYFTLLNVPTDTSTIVVSYIGYRNSEIPLSPQMPKTNFVIELDPAGQTLDEVTVVTEREDILNAGNNNVSVIKMSPKKLATLPNLGEKDIMRSFQLMPGVSGSNESSSGLYVRGGTPDQNLILFDGFTVYHVDHLYGFFSAFNSNALKDVQLYKGGFESKFGGRLSSVTEITGKDGNQKNFNIGADLSLLSANMFVEIPIGDKFTSSFAVRRSYKGPVYNEIFNKFNTSSTSTSPNFQSGNRGGSTAQASSYFYDLNAKLTYRPTSRDIITLSFFNGTDKLDNGFSRSSSTSPGSSATASTAASFAFSVNDLTKYGNLGSSLKWSRKWSDRLYGNTLISFSNYYSNRNRSNENTITQASGEQTTFRSGTIEDNNLKDYSIKSDYQWDILKHHQIGFGGFATYYDISYDYSQNDTTKVLDRRNYGLLAGGYVQDRIKLFNNKLQLVPGVRFSYFDITKQNYTEPRFSAVLNVTKKFTLKAATGKYYQFANRVTREDILSGSRDFWILSDGNKVPVSSAIHYIAGFAYETKNYLFSTEGYYKTLTGISEYSLRFSRTGQTIKYDENFYTGTGMAKGIEFLVQRKYGKLTGWVSYTLAQALNHFEVYSAQDYAAAQDVRHEFKIVAIYKWKKRWDFSATWIYATGKPYTAPSGAYTVTLLDGTSHDYFTVSSKNSLRLPDYHRLDVAANYKLITKEGRDIGYLGFSLFNAYNHKNVWYNQYQISGSQIIETNVNYFGITPNITLSLKLH